MVSTMESFQSFPVSSILLYFEKRGLLDLSNIHNIPRVRVWIIGGRREAVGTVTRQFVFVAKGVGVLQILLTDVWDEVKQESIRRSDFPIGESCSSALLLKTDAVHLQRSGGRLRTETVRGDTKQMSGWWILKEV